MNIKKYFLVLLALALSTYVFFSLPNKSENIQGQEMLHGIIVSISENNGIQKITTKITDGSLKGEIVASKEDVTNILNNRDFKIGDKVMVEYNKEHEQFFISDFIRTGSLVLLFAIFVVLVIAVAKWQGVGAIAGMIVSFLILFKITIPAILNGNDPIFVAVVSAALIVPATFYMSYGFNKKTHVAVFGTLITLAIAGVLASIFSDMANLTGLASEEASFLKMGTAERINFKGLLLAGMLIGILGVLDDITIAQVSVVNEIHKHKPEIKKKELYKSAMNVGKDHIASMVNTIILIYTGAALPLLLLFFDYSESIGNILNLELIAEEIIRTLIGSIGLILAVPITTAIAVVVFLKSPRIQSRK